MLIKLEAAKQWSKKRKSEPDEKSEVDPGTPPPAKKTKTTDPPKKIAAHNISKLKGESLFGDGAAICTANKADGTVTPETDDDGIEDSIVVSEKVDPLPAKKVTGDPFGQVRDANKGYKVATGVPGSPSPAPKPERKPAKKPALNDTASLKFDVSVPAHSQGAELARKPSDVGLRAKNAAKPTPPNKVGKEKTVADDSSSKAAQDVAKPVEESKTPAVQKKFISRMTVRKPEHMPITKVGGLISDQRRQEQKEYLRLDAGDPHNPNPFYVHPTVEGDGIRIKPDLVEDAANAVQVLNGHATSPELGVSGMAASCGHGGTSQNLVAINKSSAQVREDNPAARVKHTAGAVEYGLGDDLVKITRDECIETNTNQVKESVELENVINGSRVMSVSDRTLTPGAHSINASYTKSGTGQTPATSDTNNHDTAAADKHFPKTPQSHVFMITVSQPDDPSTDTESICLTFPPSTTTWSSFYSSLSLQLAAGDMEVLAEAKTCKVRVPGQGQKKPRVCVFEIKTSVAEIIWAKVMKMVEGLGEESELVEVSFFP